MKIQYDGLVFEVTRRCNMACAHCLRGEAQCLDMSDEIIDKALEDVTCISHIVFTGGEPSINVHAIRHVLDVCKEKGIDVGGFFVATNGKEVSMDFIHVMIDWYAYCQDYDSEYCSLALSRDKFHDPIDTKNIQILRALSFFNEEEKATDFDRYEPIALGRARSLTTVRDVRRYAPTVDYDSMYDVLLLDGGEITVTADGLYLPYCDYEYAEVQDIALGNVYEQDKYKQVLYEQRIYVEDNKNEEVA